MPTIDTTRPTIQSFSREDRIRLRAEELYRQRGNRPGSPIDDWVRAEKEIREKEERGDQASEGLSRPAIRQRTNSRAN